MALMEISVVPVGTNSASFSSVVTNAVRIIEEKGLNYQITPTATVIQGDVEELMDVAKAIHRTSLSNGIDRLVTNICIDERTDKEMKLDQQVETIHQSMQ